MAVAPAEAEAQLDAYIDAHIDGWMDELARLCGQPSVSARHEGIDACAGLVAALLRARGLDAEVSPTDGGHPVVLAHARGTCTRTLLFYNHYDVQPPEPLDLWRSAPFEPVLRDGALYARGAKDDKGELMARLAALDAIKAVYGDCPCHLTFLVEGEEEIGSPHLPAWVVRHAAELRADGAIWEEGGIDADGHPTVGLGVRGLLYVEFAVQTLALDAHSERQRDLLTRLPSHEESIKTVYGIERLLLNRTGQEVVAAPFEPTCNVAGIGSGYLGEGSKTIVPARAMAKVDFRLVPDQDPHDIAAKLRRHLDATGFSDVQFTILGAEYPAVVDPDDPLVRLTSQIATEVYGLEPRVVPPRGGTTPMYPFVRKGVPVVAPGVGYHANHAHGPDEHVRIEDFRRATKHLARFVVRFAH